MNADKLKIQKIESFLKQFQSYIALIIIVVVATLINIKDGENVFLSVPNLMNVLRAVSDGYYSHRYVNDTYLRRHRSVCRLNRGIGFHRLCITDGKKRTWDVSGSTFKFTYRWIIRFI